MYLVGVESHFQCTGKLRWSTSIDDAIVSDEVPDNTDGIMDGSLGLVDDHLGTTSD